MNLTLVGESTDTPCNPTRSNTIIKTKTNGYKMADDANWDDWVFAIVFPDNEKAQYFQQHFKQDDMHDYREGMLKADYLFHIIHFRYPREKELYADQLTMTTDFTM